MTDAAEFSPATQQWLRRAFEAPTTAQVEAWASIATGTDTLVVAPTGSGKTLAAFLWGIDRTLHESRPQAGTSLLYISPLKALAFDVERNLRAPLIGITQLAAESGHPLRELTVGVRTGDTSANERRRLAREPADILVTTPESLYLMLTSAVRETLRDVHTVIVDEIHAIAGTKRGAHLALSLARLEELANRRPQRIGLSATVRPPEAVAEFLSGAGLGPGVNASQLDSNSMEPGIDDTRSGISATSPLAAGSDTAPSQQSPGVRVVSPRIEKVIDIDVISPVEDLSDLGSIPLPQPTPLHVGRDESATVEATGSMNDSHVNMDVSGNNDTRADAANHAGATSAPDYSGSAAGMFESSPSIWPHVTHRILELIDRHRTTLIFTNSRRGAERLTAQLNELHAGRLVSHDQNTPRLLDTSQRFGTAAQNPGASGTAVGVSAIIAKAHHGSMSRTTRTQIEGELKAGLLPAVVATSSLELGIDMGSIDLVIQVGAPPSVASALQRIGRAGHQVGAISHGLMIPTHRGDLLTSALTSHLASQGRIEKVHQIRQPLDVLAQQIVAMAAGRPWKLEDMLAVVRSATPYAELSTEVFRAVLDMLAGRYPSDEFSQLRPRLIWDRTTDEISARPGALMLATTNAGTIPDRGLYGVFLVGGDERSGNKRVGELDEEMVFESRVGDTFMLGTASWRIQEITPDRVLVTPATGMPGRLPFWRGDGAGRPAELGRAMGEQIAVVSSAAAPAEILRDWGLDDWAIRNLLEYLAEQQAATGYVPDHQTIVVERFKDDLGDWRWVIHSPWGAAVHAPWALLIARRFMTRFGLDVAAMHADDGIVLRIPDTQSTDEFDPLNPSGLSFSGVSVTSATPPESLHSDASEQIRVETDASGAASLGELSVEDLLFDPAELSQAVIDAVSGSAQFAARFREAAARSLLLPRARPEQRQPLWQQRQRAGQLLSVAARYPEFPILHEAIRECLHDDFDVDALIDLMHKIGTREVRMVDVQTSAPSPFAHSLLFGYIGQFLYEGDSPLADRRAAALSLDPGLLAQVLGSAGTGIDDLITPEALDQVSLDVSLQSQVTSPERVFDVLRQIGPLPLARLVPFTPRDGVHAIGEDPHPREASPDDAAQPDESTVTAWLTELTEQRRIFEFRIGGITHFATIEDAGRLRDALGIVPPAGIPSVFLDPVPGALADLIQRYARSHGPFSLQEIANDFGLGAVTITPHIQQLLDQGTIVPVDSSMNLRGSSHGPIAPPTEGEHLPVALRWFCHSNVLRRLRMRTISLLRQEVEPRPQAAYTALSLQWHQMGRLRGSDGTLSAIETLAGAAVAASGLESLILPARVTDFHPRQLDELLTLSEVTWVAHAAHGKNDGWISVLPASTADLLVPVPRQGTSSRALELKERIGSGASWFELRDPAMSESDQLDLLWELVWDGHITSTSFAPIRALISGKRRGGTATNPQRTSRGVRRSMLSGALRASTPPIAAGRWIPTPTPAAGSTRATAAVYSLMDRHGLVTKGCIPTEFTGGFSAFYTALREPEEKGLIRRGYFIDHLGGAQFALPEAADLLRDVDPATQTDGVFDATDPASPFGLALGWPTPIAAESGTGHLPGRKVGGRVVIVQGELILYLERGGKSLLRFTSDESLLRHAATLLTRAIHDGGLGSVILERIEGRTALDHPALTPLLIEAGFVASPRGLLLRPATNSFGSTRTSPTPDARMGSGIQRRTEPTGKRGTGDARR